MSQEHFIKNIEIKNFKLFKDFKAEGFGRVNLIGGKNNVGKTAFMEACFIIDNFKNFYLNNHKEINTIREKLYFEIIKSLIIIQINRFGNSFILSWILNNYNLNIFSDFEIEIPKQIKINAEDYFIVPETYEKNKTKFWWNYGGFNLLEHKKNKYFNIIREEYSLPKINIFNFVSMCNNHQMTLRKLLSKIKKENKNDLINNYLEELFDIERIDMTEDEIILIKNGRTINISEYGDGVKNFINIVMTILYYQNSVIFIDEIENGIHYTSYDRLWEIILTLSKEQNVQVFATTHSKECIESFNRVQKKLQDNEAFYFEMYKNAKKDKIEVRQLDSEQLEYELTHNGRFRGE